jgi:hypothetical protein
MGAGDMRILKSNSGFSLVFVLGIMLMLLTIGASVLAAAAANTGFTRAQRTHIQATLLDTAVHENIMYSLASHSGEGSLWAQLVLDVYNDPDMPPAVIEVGLYEHNLAAAAPGSNVRLATVTVAFPVQDFFTENPVPAVFHKMLEDDGDGNEVEVSYPVRDRIPGSATLAAEMEVTVAIIAWEDTMRQRTIVSTATYSYTGGRLSDDPEEKHDDEHQVNDYYGREYCEDCGRFIEMIFEDDGYGKWRLLRHAKMD